MFCITCCIGEQIQARTSFKSIASEIVSHFHIVHMEPCTKEDFVIMAERVLTMREDTEPEITGFIAGVVIRRSLGRLRKK